MKKNNLFIVGILFFFLSTNIFSQNNEKFLQKACCNFNEGLKSEIDGIVISAMINVMRMYYEHPTEDFDQINQNLDTLIVKGSTEQIQFMARLIKQYLDNEIDLDWMMDFNNEAIQHYLSLLSVSDLRKIAYGY